MLFLFVNVLLGASKIPAADTGKVVSKESAKQLAERKYKSFLKNKKYQKYFEKDSTAEAAKYTFLDVNRDNIPELLIQSRGEMEEWFNTIVFTYNKKTKKMVYVTDIYSFGDIRYSKKYRALVFTDFRDSDYGGIYYWKKIKSGKIADYMSVGWDGIDYSVGQKHYFQEINDKRDSVDQQEVDCYFSELKYITFKNL